MLAFFNIYVLNIVYIFCGFAFMTTLYSNPSASIGYRAIGILLAIGCLIKSRFKLSIPNDFRFKSYLLILLAYSVMVLYTLLWGEYSEYHGASKNTMLLFLIGVTWIPLLGYIAGINKIDYNNVVVMLFIILLFVIGKGYLGIASQIASTSGRYNLNESQSTLTFGDKGMMLSIVSFALLLSTPTYLKSIICKIILLGGICLGVMAAMKGGSRGPLLSGVFALLFLSTCAPKNIKRLLMIFFIGLIGAGAATLRAIQNFAPALYERIMLSLLTGDTSGRDSVFSEAINSWDFIIGGTPIVLINDGFFGFHNVYITLSMGIGVVPLILFLILVFSLFVSFYKKNKNRTLCGAGAYFAYGLFVFYIFRGITGVNMVSTNEFNLILLMSCYVCSKWYNKLNINSKIKHI